MKITRDDDFGGAVLNCAVRYALGRVSYMPMLVMGEIRPMLPDCSDKTLWCFARDIDDFLKCPSVIDKPSFYYAEKWKRFYDDVKAEIKRREAEKRE